MANTDNAFGLRPVRYRNGAPWSGRLTPYYVRSDDATALFIGDPVDIIGEANQSEYLGFPAGTVSAVTIATAGDVPGTGSYITGVVCSVLADDQSSPPYRAASTERIVMVCDDPDVVFQIQDDGGGALTYDTVGLNAVLISGTGSTVTGLSGWELDGGTSDGPAADASNQLFILAASNVIGNDVSSDYCIWDVLINQHRYRPFNGLGVA
jgi:hypothetical protein